MATPATITRTITIGVTDIVFSRLVEKAREAGATPGRYAQQLFDAAWCARCAPTGDAALDRAVAAIDAADGSNLTELTRLRAEIVQARQGAAAAEGSAALIRDREVRIAGLQDEIALLRAETARLRSEREAGAAAFAALEQKHAALSRATVAAARPECETRATPDGATPSQIKTMMLYRKLGWSAREIAVEMGVPCDLVADAIGAAK